jgi:hypothetical protein
MRMGTGVAWLGCAAPCAEGAPAVEASTSVEKPAATAASALATEYVRVVVMPGTVGGVANRPAIAD